MDTHPPLSKAEANPSRIRLSVRYPRSLDYPRIRHPIRDNTDHASGADSLFLQMLPAEMRNRVYRAALVSGDRIHIDSNYTFPALLRVNNQIRHEASSIYYLENIFKVNGGACDCNTYLRLKQTGMQRYIFEMLDALTLSFDMPGITFNYRNMLEWIHNYQEGCVPRLRTHPGASKAVNAVSGAFDLVDVSCKGMTWAHVCRLLAHYKAAMEKAGVW